LAMQFPVSDQAAIALAGEFYQALTNQLPLESAVSEARKAIFSEGEALEWGTPVLFSRSLNGKLFEIAEQREEEMGKSILEPWWARLAAGDTMPPVVPGATGDVIIATIGAGSRNVAAGKNISQQIYEVAGPPTPDDKQIIAQRFAEVDRALAAQQHTIDRGLVQMVEIQLQLLRGELVKTGNGESPSASTITLVGNWLLDNVPHLAESLAALFSEPAVGRVMGKAGESAVIWVKQRFAS
jgi:hypothetical protein